ncbi:MAG: DUF6265 family protein [Planctomycetota bacterium]|jgi:hypothetical protein
MTRITLLALLLCLPLLGGEPKDDLAALKWLAGTWTAEKWGGTFTSYYSTPEGGKILSHSRLVAGGAVKFYEFELFEVVDGKVMYTPHPAGKRAKHSFPLVETGTNRAVFRNDAHDWPKQLVFERPDQKKLVITLTGGAKKEIFAFDRAD